MKAMTDQHPDPGRTSPGPRDQVVTRLAPWPVADTIAMLSAVAAARGMKLFAEIDYSGEAKASGMHLPDTKLVIFGSSQAVTRIVDAAPEAGLDLPFRVLVWSDARQTKITYTTPAALAARYHLSPQMVAGLMELDEIVDAVLDG
jgi:uncharacterized protein (DUF302 family)